MSNLEQRKEPDLLDKFADGLAKVAVRLKTIENSSEFKRQQRLARTQALCILIALPVALLAVWLCERFGWPRQIYLPIVMIITIVGGRRLGTIIANKKKA